MVGYVVLSTTGWYKDHVVLHPSCVLVRTILLSVWILLASIHTYPPIGCVVDGSLLRARASGHPLIHLMGRMVCGGMWSPPYRPYSHPVVYVWATGAVWYQQVLTTSLWSSIVPLPLCGSTQGV
jgi:hypothetical protein